MLKYEVISNYAASIFNDRHDAIGAIMLLSDYGPEPLKREDIERDLEQNGSFERFPLALHVFEDPEEEGVR